MSASRSHPLLDPRILLRGLVLIATMVALGLLFEKLGLKSLLDESWIDHEVRGQGVTGEALFVLVGAVVVAVGMPRQVVCFLGGYAFGFTIGTGLSLLATLLGSLTAFYYARFMGREMLARRFPGKLKRIDDFLAGNPMVMALILRLSPLSYGLAANIGAGVSGVRAFPFFVGSALGYLPQTIVFALAGAGVIASDRTFTVALSVVLFVVSSVLGLWLWRRYRAAQGLPEDETEEN